MPYCRRHMLLEFGKLTRITLIYIYRIRSFHAGPQPDSKFRGGAGGGGGGGKYFLGEQNFRS